jgi:two-component system sensor histidine kinase RegB
MPTPTALRLRGLTALRLTLLCAQGLWLAVAPADGHAAGARGPLSLLALVVGAGAAAAVGPALRARAGAGGPTAVAAVDLALFGAALWASGGAESPMSLLLLVQVAVFAALLPAAPAAALGVGAALAYAAGLWPEALHGHAHGHAHGGEAHGAPAHLWAHLLSFIVADAILVGLVGRLSAAMGAAEAEATEAQRLAAVGTLAAGVAHALGTPLGTLRLLTEELEADLPDALRPHPAAAGVVRQLDRARGILDALLAGDGAEHGEGAWAPFALHGAVESWVEEWRAAQAPPVTVLVEGAAPAGAWAPGPAAGWRAALWCALDNGRRAGGPLRVRVVGLREGVLIEVHDHGGPLDPAVAARAGEPFFSAWPGGGGVGLGLHSAGRFARARGGWVRLRPGPAGACAALLLPGAPAG